MEEWGPQLSTETHCGASPSVLPPGGSAVFAPFSFPLCVTPALAESGCKENVTQEQVKLLKDLRCHLVQVSKAEHVMV